MTDLHLHPSLREPAQTSKAWPFEEARKLIKRYPDGKPGGAPVLFETGYGPSGLPHIGTFNEVLRTTMVRRAYETLTGGAPTRLVAFSDDMDGLRKVPDNVPQQEMLREHLGKPLTAIPDPFGKYESFAHHNNAMLREFLDRFGFEYEFVSSTERYRSGAFDDALKNVLRHNQDILDIMLPTLREDLAALADVADAYDDAAPDLLDVLGNLTVTSRTVTEKRAQLDTFFSDLGGLADTSARVLADNEADLIRVGEVTAPLLRLLAVYSPQLPCLLEGAENYEPRLSKAFSGNQVKQYLELFSAQYEAYDEDDRPEYGEVGRGPWCLGLPNPPEPIGPQPLRDGSDKDSRPPDSRLPYLGALLDLLGARRLRCGQRRRAREFGFRVRQGRIGPRQLRARLIERRLVRARIDREKKLPGPHILAVGEVYALQISRRARPHFDTVDRFETADKIIPLRHVADEGLGHGNGKRRRTALSLVAAARTGSQRERKAQDGREEKALLHDLVFSVEAFRHRATGRGEVAR